MQAGVKICVVLIDNSDCKHSDLARKNTHFDPL